MIEHEDDGTLTGHMLETGNFNATEIESEREPHERDYDSPGHLRLFTSLGTEEFTQRRMIRCGDSGHNCNLGLGAKCRVWCNNDGAFPATDNGIREVLI